jgi:hypothetical protein
MISNSNAQAVASPGQPAEPECSTLPKRPIVHRGGTNIRRRLSAGHEVTPTDAFPRSGRISLPALNTGGQDGVINRKATEVSTSVMLTCSRQQAVGGMLLTIIVSSAK